MAQLFLTMSCHNKLFFVAAIALVLALCRANHIDNGGSSSSSKKDAASHTTVGTTIAPPVNHNNISDSTKKSGVHEGQHVASAQHPFVTLESVKGTNGEHNVSFSNNATEPSPIVSFTKGASKDVGLHQLHKLCDYLKPICNSTDKLAPKQLTKIQSNFKRIVEVSAGKLGFCFMDHFGFDPNLEPISKVNLVKVCNSKDLSSNLKGSFKSFETCAIPSWDVAVDNELDKILAARANCTKSHNHAKNETVIPELIHEEDEDESSLISAIVNKVFEDNKGQFANSSNVKFIDVSQALNMSTSMSKEEGLSLSKSGNKTANELTRDAIMNDPNTVMVLLDDSSSKTSAPASAANKTTSHHQVEHAMSKNSTISTTTRPAPLGTNGDSMLANNKTFDFVKHSTDRVASGASNITEKLAPTKMPISMNATRPLTTPSSLKLTEAPQNKIGGVLASNKTNVEFRPKLNAVKPITTMKPKPVFQTLEEVLKRQEKEKQIFENRLREEREAIIRELQKRQDEIDAKNAIRALQYQRDASINHNSDARLHQLEHDRQMAIDPIGHTIKHQQYEFNKQQRMINGRK